MSKIRQQREFRAPTTIWEWSSAAVAGMVILCECLGLGGLSCRNTRQ